MRLCCLVALSSVALAACAPGQAPLEQRAARAFNNARSNPLELHAFLERMPKGADLHMHLSGAVYAETFLLDAAEDKLCVDPKALKLTKRVGVAETPLADAVCVDGQVPAAAALKDQQLYDRLVDSFSMRGFVPTPGVTGHDQFFATFDRFGGIAKSHLGEWLEEVAGRAAAQNEQYLEIMHSPPFPTALRLAALLDFPGNSRGRDATPTMADLDGLRKQLIEGGLLNDVEMDRKQLADALQISRERERCGAAGALPACHVQIRFLGQVLRQNEPVQVFAQTLLYFELASKYPELVVGINYVQPEDAYLAMAEYHRQMAMLDYLHGLYPTVHISLHAGELAPGMVPPEGLRFHIREAVELGHAERIGHGVDVMQEDDPAALLKEMAARHVMVEVNLTSNDVILGVSANHHSLPAYRAARVPVALSTDDEGVSRIDLTHEYARAAVDFNLNYADLKAMARTSLEHAFLPGPSLWQRPDELGSPVSPCAGQALGAAKPSGACAAFLATSARAAEQWELEHRLTVFEGSFP